LVGCGSGVTGGVASAVTAACYVERG
jgi:hypothetical protein